MDTMIYAVIKDKVKPMHYSIDVMFRVNEKYGTISAALETLEKNDREGFEVLRTLVTLMVNDAELCRRAEGYDPSELITEKDIPIRLKPIDVLNLKQAVADTISAGYKQEHSQENEEVDLGLLELQKKEEAGK